jgi:hypothetical protein
MIKKIRFTVSIILFIPLLAMANAMTITPFPDLPQSMKDEEKTREAEQKRNGFYKTESTSAKFLLDIPKRAPAEIEKFKLDNNPGDTHLKASASQIKLAFPFPSLAAIKNKKIIGYAAMGSWKNGWTGIKVFFRENNSVCSYSYDYKSGTEFVAPLNQDIVKNIINGKMSYIDIEGNYNNGMLYTISWFDKKVWHTLDCANKIYDKELTKSFVALACELDRDLI